MNFTDRKHEEANSNRIRGEVMICTFEISLLSHYSQSSRANLYMFETILVQYIFRFTGLNIENWRHSKLYPAPSVRKWVKTCFGSSLTIPNFEKSLRPHCSRSSRANYHTFTTIPVHNISWITGQNVEKWRHRSNFPWSNTIKRVNAVFFTLENSPMLPFAPNKMHDRYQCANWHTARTIS